MKKAWKWIGIAVLSPILLFIILATLLYLPPVQNWVVGKVVAFASEETGMAITIERVSLEFPLDLGIEGVKVIQQEEGNDTIADIQKVIADVRLLPLLKGRVVVNELALRQAKINTNGFISDVCVKGEFQELWLSSKGIDLRKETAKVNGARLADAKLDITLSDTAAIDTTTSEMLWRIYADSLSIARTSIKIHLPGDTFDVGIYMGKTVLREADIDLGASIYKVSSISWADGGLTYDNRQEPEAPGLDINHIALNSINLRIDSIEYADPKTSLQIKNVMAKEKSGLEITQLSGNIAMDSANINLPHLTLRTPDSDIELEAAIGLNAFNDSLNSASMGGDSLTTPDGSRMMLRLNAQLGKQDLIRFMGELPQKFIEQYPNHPLSIKGSADGNMQQMDIAGIDISLPTALHITANGITRHLTDITRLFADIKWHVNAENMNFATTLLDKSIAENYRIPQNITLDGNIHADGPHYATTLTAKEGDGIVTMKADATLPRDDKGEMRMAAIAYDANISIDNLNLHHFMPNDSLYTFTADIKAKGHGTDFFSKYSQLDAEMQVHQFLYGSWNLDDIIATADLHDGRGVMTVKGHNELLDGIIELDALLSTKRIEATLGADVSKMDLYRMRLVDAPLSVGMCGHVDIASDMKQTHYASGLFNDLYIQDSKKLYRPKDIGLLLNTNPDTTYLRAQSGDFILKLDASGGYEQLIKQGNTLADSIMAQFEKRIIDQPAIKAVLPTLKLHLESKSDNPVANFLKTRDINFKELLLDIDTSPITGINGDSHIYSLNYDSIRIDTVRLNLKQKGDRLTYNGQIRNNRRNPQFVFNTLIDGSFHRRGAITGLRYYDERDRLGVRIGATAEMEEDGLRLRLVPDRLTLGYKEFNLNKDNYVFFASDKRVRAKIDLIADDKTGAKIYSEDLDSTMLQNLTLSLNRIDLGEITSVFPYMPHITGYLDGDYHLLQDQDERFSIASDMTITNMACEGSPIGNLGTEFVYLMKEDDTHAVEARLMLDDEEFGLLSGTYQGEGEIDATLTLTRMPLSMANGLVPDKIIGLDGYGDGNLTIKGTTARPDVNGEIYLDSSHLISVPYGIRMRFDDDPVRIVDSHLLLENFGLYAYNDEPLNLMGSIDFSNTDRIMMDMRMQARNLLLINSKQEAGSIAFGKAFVNFFARMQGPLEMLSIRGKLDVLGSTDMTYMLLDSPLSTDNRLDELVKFTDFSDSTQTVVSRPLPSGLDMDLTVSVAQGAHIVCDLNPEHTNYVDLTGGGDLHMKYNTDGIGLTGRYTLVNGEMKYSLPIIPLKTFNIKNGSYVEFTGDPMNPRLNITATERTKATVSGDGGQSRSVAFDCGVVITKTLNDMGLEFVIDAPEDQNVSSELATMSTEQRGKIAVTMLTTGMYLADGNTGGFSMNNALSSFLESEINSITGSALKTIDLSVGIDNSIDASGDSHTDYSFKFAKRFFNNRLKIELGGKVSSGASDPMGQKQSFFDNVSMEYRLNQDATQNVKLFYSQNVYDWLEGYTSKYGGGFVWRRKLDNFWDILTFWKKSAQPMPMMRQPAMTMPRDTIRTDSINAPAHETK
ncbi:MAG: translocation/assembly module TamB domain-containing protein [Prevotella sp.]|nr:translocation/assembly module TamB domain-containing protein [Prevotella sp.]